MLLYSTGVIYLPKSHRNEYGNLGQSRYLSGIAHCLSPLWPRFNSQPRRSISRDFSLADHTLPTRPEPACQTMAQSPQNGTTQPMDIEEEGRSSTLDRRWLMNLFILATQLWIWKPFTQESLCLSIRLGLMGSVWCFSSGTLNAA